MSEQRNQQKQQGGQRQQAEVDRKRWREIGQKQEEQDKKRREAGIVPGDDKAPGGGLVGD
jgi:hypothetical protein